MAGPASGGRPAYPQAGAPTTSPGKATSWIPNRRPARLAAEASGPVRRPDRRSLRLEFLATHDRLRRRGVLDPAASLTAEAGIAVFKVAFDRWVDANNELGWSELVRGSLAELKVLVAS